MSAPSADELIAQFPNSTLTKIVGKPSYETLKIVYDELKENAATEPSTRGGGQHGHIAIVTGPAVYATMSAVPFNIPNNPGFVPHPAAGGTAPQIA